MPHTYSIFGWPVWMIRYWADQFGRSAFLVRTPLFYFGLHLHSPEIYRHVYSTRLELAWWPRAWRYAVGEKLYRHEQAWVWREEYPDPRGEPA